MVVIYGLSLAWKVLPLLFRVGSCSSSKPSQLKSHLFHEAWGILQDYPLIPASPPCLMSQPFERHSYSPSVLVRAHWFFATPLPLARPLALL